MQENEELTRRARMTTFERLGTGFIAWETGADLGYLSDHEHYVNHQTNAQIHRPPGIRNGHTSRDTLPSMGHR